MTDLSDPRIRLVMDGPVAIITLARPEKLNALDTAMIRALGEAAAAVDRDTRVRTAILTGEGKAFCAGGDIAAWADETPADFQRFWVREGHRVFDALARLRVPLIAVINGVALGGGLELAATADIRIAETQARFGLPEATLGMVPGWSGTQRMVARFGSQTIRRLALAGEMFSADQALQCGLVEQIVASGEGLAAAKTRAANIAQSGPLAIETAKLLINAAEGEDRAAAMEVLAGGLVARTADLQTGIAAFRARQKPDFKGE